jgi:DNA-binding response OmpR family regulator
MEILVIEDEKKVAELIKRGLEEYSYAVSIASDGETGVMMAFSKDYHLIITDIILPKVNGIDLCRQSVQPNLMFPLSCLPL